MEADVQALDDELQKNPFDQFMDFHVIAADKQLTVLEFQNKGTKWDNPNGTLYGGVLYFHVGFRNGNGLRRVWKSRAYVGFVHELSSPCFFQYGHPR